MFYFLQTKKKSNESDNYYKGKLFEELIKDYLEKVGYFVTLRVKVNSLEYDIEGKHRVSGAEIIGEAKAHVNVISGSTFSSFVGKYLVSKKKKPNLQALYLSTSPLTAEAEDFNLSAEEVSLKVYTGKTLFDSVIDNLDLEKFESLFRKVERLNYLPHNKSILKTDVGIFQLVSCSNTKSAIPTYLAVFDKNGQLIEDDNFLQLIIDNTPDFNDYNAINSKNNSHISQKKFSNSIMTGTSWIDYKFPADPSFFVGREQIIDNITKHIHNALSPNIIQVKSRSGVGKSSTLIFLKNILSKECKVDLYDARNIKNSLDFYLMVSKFFCSYIPQDMREVEDILEKFVKSSKNKTILMIDQFETTFGNSELFNLYETLATYFLNYKSKFFLIIARKDDLLTTYDNKEIDISKLNLISKHFNLKDFTPSEASLLIKKINDDSEKKIGEDIKSYLLEFSQGFPWLLKRTAAHIYNLLSDGSSDKELVTSGLKLNDLFDEELEDLDESEREYLVRISSFLPATFTELERHFDQDPLLTPTLEKLIKNRLLRLSGLTYDTYNDVFKEYLIYQKLPEFHQQNIFRIALTSVLPVIHWAIKVGNFSLKDITSEFSFSKGSAYNSIKELTSIGILERQQNHWVVKQRIKDIYGQGKLGEYIRAQLISNRYIAKLISLVSKSKFKKSKLPDFLKSELPYVEASNETWIAYSKTLVSWLVGTKLINESKNDFLTQNNENSKKISEDLGNLNPQLFSYAGRKAGRNNKNFTPQFSGKKIIKLLIELDKDGYVLDTWDKKLVFDLKKLGFIRGYDKDRKIILLTSEFLTMLSSKNKEKVIAKIIFDSGQEKILSSYKIIKNNPQISIKEFRTEISEITNSISSYVYKVKTTRILFEWAKFMEQHLD